MRTVALLSGGKDSCFNMLKCVEAGHEIVALANLRPAEPGVEDSDSYMFQTVGHGAIEAVAECMELPLFREGLAGTARDQTLTYETGDGDEVEDLFRLLARVKEAVPDVQAVASGAILSTYQRVRVEHVCSRLGLTSLAFLWHRDQHELLQEMVDSGMDAILVKVCSMGLTVRGHLGRSIAALQPSLLRLHERCGLNVCGEGGEYETFTLDLPLYKRRIVIDEAETEVEQDDEYAPVARYVIKRWHTEAKGEDAGAEVPHARPEASEAMAEQPACEEPTPVAPLPRAVLCTAERTGEAGVGGSEQEVEGGAPYEVHSPPRSAAAWRGVAWRRGVLRSAFFCPRDALAGADTAAQARDVMDQVQACLEDHGLRADDACFIELGVRDMAEFGTINGAYCTYFGPNPPSRSCVELPALPHAVMASCTALLRGREAARGSDGHPGSLPRRRVLHVQSISHWAPTCIGPYSQVNSVSGVALCAGQIGLVPGSMRLPSGGCEVQVEQMLRNCAAVLDAVRATPGAVLGGVLYSGASVGVAAQEAALRQTAAWLSGEEWPPMVLHVTVSHLPRSACAELALVAAQHQVRGMLREAGAERRQRRGGQWGGEDATGPTWWVEDALDGGIVWGCALARAGEEERALQLLAEAATDAGLETGTVAALVAVQGGDAGRAREVHGVVGAAAGDGAPWACAFLLDGTDYGKITARSWDAERV